MPTEDFITIFSDRDFKGSSMQLKTGAYNFESGDSGPVGNDNISSIKIPKGWVVTAYVDSGLTGESREFTQDVAELGSFNDKISSLSVCQIADDGSLVEESR